MENVNALTDLIMVTNILETSVNVMATTPTPWTQTPPADQRVVGVLSCAAGGAPVSVGGVSVTSQMTWRYMVSTASVTMSPVTETEMVREKNLSDVLPPLYYL